MLSLLRQVESKASALTILILSSTFTSKSTIKLHDGPAVPVTRTVYVSSTFGKSIVAMSPFCVIAAGMTGALLLC